MKDGGRLTYRASKYVELIIFFNHDNNLENSNLTIISYLFEFAAKKFVNFESN